MSPKSRCTRLEFWLRAKSPTGARTSAIASGVIPTSRKRIKFSIFPSHRATTQGALKSTRRNSAGKRTPGIGSMRGGGAQAGLNLGRGVAGCSWITKRRNRQAYVEYLSDGTAVNTQSRSSPESDKGHQTSVRNPRPAAHSPASNPAPISAPATVVIRPAVTIIARLPFLSILSSQGRPVGRSVGHLQVSIH